ncbi:hypothetical protein QBZ16_004178 [Prototheca wickerhamii]|uniref:Uncharacterized protein n=1 Tax=Prototheca wickerhamii TaxID=3111 RepID=A0AAD9IJI2_PROWI|nr:hypothetical protein QBZ16_004178 [Prototheca wickerhamii]
MHRHPPAENVAKKSRGYCHECDEPHCQVIWSDEEGASSCDDDEEIDDDDDDDDCAQSISSSSSFDSAESLFGGRFRLGSNERLRRRAVRRVRRAMLELSENARAWWEDLARARQRALELALVDMGPVVEEAALAVVRGRLERAADAAREQATRDLLRELEDEKKGGVVGGGGKKGGGKRGADKAKKAVEPPAQPKEVAGKALQKAPGTTKKDSAAQAAAQRQVAAAAAKKEAEEAAYEAALEQRRRELEADAQRRAAAEAELLRHARQASLRELAESASAVQDAEAASAENGTAAKKAAKAAAPARAETRAPTVVPPPKKRASSVAGREPAAPEPAAAPAASNASTATTAAVATSATAGSPTASVTQPERKRPVTRAPLIVGAGERTASLPPRPRRGRTSPKPGCRGPAQRRRGPGSRPRGPRLGPGPTARLRRRRTLTQRRGDTGRARRPAAGLRDGIPAPNGWPERSPVYLDRRGRAAADLAARRGPPGLVDPGAAGLSGRGRRRAQRGIGWLAGRRARPRRRALVVARAGRAGRHAADTGADVRGPARVPHGPRERTL